MKPAFTVEERAVRFQRRYTGAWRTNKYGIRYRRRLRIEWARMAVAQHDLWTQAIWRKAIVPVVRPVVVRLAKALG